MIRSFLMMCATLFAGASLAQTVNYNQVASDDVWVYENSTDPTGDYYLLAWAFNNNQNDLWPSFPAPSDTSYSYLQWNLAGAFEPGYYYVVSSARLTLTHRRNPGWQLSEPTVLLRKVASNWDEFTYDLSADTDQPGAVLAEGNRSAYVASGVDFAVTFDLNTQAFQDYLNASLQGGRLSFSISSALSPLGPFGAKHYKFYSRDYPGAANAWPRLQITAQRFAGSLVKGEVTFNELSRRAGLEKLEIEIRNPGSAVALERHVVIPDEIKDIPGSPINVARYTLPTRLSGLKDIAVKAQGWLQSVKTVNIVSETNGVHFELLSGDIDGTNVVDDGDLTELILAFGSTPGVIGPGKEADLNRDGLVDDGDLTILILNFGLSGQP